MFSEKNGYTAERMKSKIRSSITHKKTYVNDKTFFGRTPQPYGFHSWSGHSESVNVEFENDLVDLAESPLIYYREASVGVICTRYGLHRGHFFHVAA